VLSDLRKADLSTYVKYIPYINQENGEITLQQFIDHMKLIFTPSIHFTYFFGSNYLIKFKMNFTYYTQRSKEEWHNFKVGCKKLK